MRHPQTVAAEKKKAKSAAAPDRMIVVSRSAGNISWLPLFFGTTPTTIMQLVNMTEHRTGCWEGARRAPCGRPRAPPPPPLTPQLCADKRQQRCTRSQPETTRRASET